MTTEITIAFVAIAVFMLGTIFSIKYLCNTIKSLEERTGNHFDVLKELDEDIDKVNKRVDGLSNKLFEVIEDTSKALILTSDVLKETNDQLVKNREILSGALEIMRQNATEGGTHALIEELKTKL